MVGVILAGGAVVLLLIVANVQLWRVAEDQQTAAPAAIPQLPKAVHSSGGSLLKEVDQTIANLESEINQASATAGATSPLTTQLGNLTSQAAALAPSLHSLTSVNDKLGTISSVAPEVSAIAPQLASLERRLAGTRQVAARLRTLSAQIKAARGFRAKVGELNSKTSNLLGNAGALEGDVNGLSSKLGSFGGQLEALDARINAVSGTVGEIGASVETTNHLLGILVDFICKEVPEQCEEPAEASPGVAVGTSP